MSIKQFIELITSEPIDKQLLINELWQAYDVDYNFMTDNEIDFYLNLGA